MRTIPMRTRDPRPDDRQRGQALVEFAIVIPIILTLVVSVAELGFIFGKLSSLGYATREGARTGSALAQGYQADCLANATNNKVDGVLVGAVQRILKSPDAGIDLDKVQQIRIFKADGSGAETSPYVNIWTYVGTGAGPDIDPGAGGEFIDFAPQSVAWPACSRQNGPTYDSIGVTVTYTYDFVTPLMSVIDAVAGGNLSVTLSETTVMSLNPTIR